MQITLHVLPRETMTWEEFLAQTPSGSIALDGMVSGGPRFDQSTYHINFDHHDGVVREATMCTSRQVFFAIKNGAITHAPVAELHLWMNDPDQDASLAAWLLANHSRLDGTKSIPVLNRLIELTDRLDVTGGAFPMDLRDELVQQHNWVFQPYSESRKNGSLAVADAAAMREILEGVFARLDKFVAGEPGLLPLDTRHEILHESRHGYKMIAETGGNDARYYLFCHGLDAYISLVTRIPAGFVYSIGRRSRYVRFPVVEIYNFLNQLEPGWGGSDIVGGSPRSTGSRFSPAELATLVDAFLTRRGGSCSAQ